MSATDDSAWWSLTKKHAGTPNYVLRQTSVANRMTWRTPQLLPVAGQTRLTVAFTGGLGYLSQPQTQGFALLLNSGSDERVVFDVKLELTKWESASGDTTLEYWPTISSSQDSMGVFFVTFPASYARSGHVDVAVQSLSGAGRRYFSVLKTQEVTQATLSLSAVRNGRPLPTWRHAAGGPADHASATFL